MKVSIPSTSVSKFYMIVVVDAAGCFSKLLFGHQCKSSFTLILTVLPQKECHNSVLIYVLKEMIWCYMYIISDTVKFFV